MYSHRISRTPFVENSFSNTAHISTVRRSGGHATGSSDPDPFLVHFQTKIRLCSRLDISQHLFKEISFKSANQILKRCFPLKGKLHRLSPRYLNLSELDTQDFFVSFAFFIIIKWDYITFSNICMIFFAVSQF